MCFGPFPGLVTEGGVAVGGGGGVVVVGGTAIGSEITTLTDGRRETDIGLVVVDGVVVDGVVVDVVVIVVMVVVDEDGGITRLGTKGVAVPGCGASACSGLLVCP
jgi:hypothetical protein